jgi:hypothetical protein
MKRQVTNASCATYKLIKTEEISWSMISFQTNDEQNDYCNIKDLHRLLVLHMRNVPFMGHIALQPKKNIIQIYNINSGERCAELKHREGQHISHISRLADGRIICCSHKHMYIWNKEKTSFTHVYVNSEIRNICALNDGRIAVKSRNKTHVYDFERKEWTQLNNDNGNCVIQLRNGAIVTSNGGKKGPWSLTITKPNNCVVVDVEFFINIISEIKSNVVCISGDIQLLFLDLETGTKRFELEMASPTADVLSLHDGRFLTFSAKEILLWNANTFDRMVVYDINLHFKGCYKYMIECRSNVITILGRLFIICFNISTMEVTAKKGPFNNIRTLL